MLKVLSSDSVPRGPTGGAGLCSGPGSAGRFPEQTVRADDSAPSPRHLSAVEPRTTALTGDRAVARLLSERPEWPGGGRGGWSRAARALVGRLLLLTCHPPGGKMGPGEPRSTVRDVGSRWKGTPAGHGAGLAEPHPHEQEINEVVPVYHEGLFVTQQSTAETSRPQ